MALQLSVLTCPASAAVDRSFGKLAQLLGLTPNLLSIPAGTSASAHSALPILGCILAMSHGALAELMGEPWFATYLEICPFVLIYGFSPSGQDFSPLRQLTGGLIAGVRPSEPGRKRVHVHADVAHHHFAVSGLSYDEPTGPELRFVANLPAPPAQTYISVNGHPYFLAIQGPKTTFFFLAEESLLDIDQPVPPGRDLRPWYAQLTALAIFLRSALGPQCWSAPLTPASFVVDDPYLRKRYGFFQYDRLLPELERIQSALTVAFIPYNSKKTDPGTVALARRYAHRFSIAVHGCDHTDAEFASLDEPWLEGTAMCALKRMEEHEKRTGMPFDNVMVFPQGCFSRAAIQAVSRCAFGSAVNSTPWAVDAAEDPLQVKDLLSVALTRYGSFPLFIRRYPIDLFDFAFDVLFQKPLLGVEHHQFFRGGTEPFAKFVNDLAAFPQRPTWLPLGQAIQHACVSRETIEGRKILRHFAAGVSYTNTGGTRVQLQVECPARSSGTDAVQVSGRPVAFQVQNGWVRYEVSLAPGERLQAVVIPSRAEPRGRKTPLQFHLAVKARRVLADVRDNYLARSDRLLRWAEKARAVLVPRK